MLPDVLDLRDVSVPHVGGGPGLTWKRRMCSGEARYVARIIFTATTRSRAFCRAL